MAGLQITPQSDPPIWTALDFKQCPNCPLSKTEFPYGPIARNLAPLLKQCASLVSYETLTLEVISKERTIRGKTSIQRALSSLIGLIMATSPCPITKNLKPMAHFHLPLANEEETV